jgi:hypothetical protein
MNNVQLPPVPPSAIATVIAWVSGYQFREAFRGLWEVDGLVVDVWGSSLLREVGSGK